MVEVCAVPAFIASALALATPKSASTQWWTIADRICTAVSMLAAMLGETEPDVLASSQETP